ncbi:low specificity L-threonine aldolase [Kribbella sandramycini]|uniref:Threonine aldolase n=1 Tax=Kribbella sandramycini TaxID=60450 RepID=A0A7Y4KUD4_9ACTN|nr:GntG family PLP-dependent aldolase [Kribbella sandramycini]MBB6568532.1 threonine aldolase [Kribbella sandramycini]NOL38880.1 low specificity L-threonine aldolase [Kribbella sandramycini]
MIDLRSDTVTRPAAGMLAAMTSAPLGDDVYGEDPTVNRLEETVAGLLGHEAGLFTVTGSLANVLGVQGLVPRGGELISEASAHVVRAELGAHAAVSGITTRTWSAPAGQIDLEQIRALIAPDLGPYFVRTSAVSVENTHNFGGGAVQHGFDALADELDARGIPLHLDGARLWNAAVATGRTPASYASRAAAAGVCLSKGLGAPIGSVLVGSAELIREARVWRKRLGAGWRQAGLLAAAGLYALDHHIDRLADDHANARLIAGLLADAAPGSVKPDQVDTNIVVADLSVTGKSVAEVVTAAKEQNVLVGGVGATQLRIVTHLDASTTDCKHAAETLARILTT